MNTISKLKEIKELAEVPETQLQWIIDRSACISFEKGDHLFSPGVAIDKLFIILEGEFILKAKRNNQFQVLGKFPQNTITGLLPYSRASKATGYAEATKPAQVLVLNGTEFKVMIQECHELTTALVHIMSSRIRQFTKREQQDDKMMSLGKLSAGLAHELNNPSSAVVRSAQELSRNLKYLPENFKNVIKIRMSDKEVDDVNEILFDKVKKGLKSWSLIEKSGREDELMDWLDDEEVADSDEIATNFTDFDIEVDDLDLIKEKTGTDYLASVIGWLNQVITTEKLVGEIEDASQRINDLVQSIKSYTHMDQSPEKHAVDIHIGLDNTITMLNHKIKSGKIEIIKHYDRLLPPIPLLQGLINQVWTNLIDNAIDAMNDTENKQLTIETLKDGNFVNIAITDSGMGIPEDIQGKIFDPFFTTKSIGQGTGLGLEFVQEIVRLQHNGAVYLKSVPGNTTFTICLPLEGSV
ncbi:MAG: signal transduction histidine kinase [Cyclobacteriaceae bacterium]|jgi:signal transduction histidine kinase